MKYFKYLGLSLLLFISFFGVAQTDVSGTISSNTTWGLSGSPYTVTGNILVSSGVTLTIEAGVTVKVNSGFYIKNEGILSAVGTSSKKIIFESSASSPSKSDWVGIRIRPTGGSSIDGSQNYSSGSQFKYVIIKHADVGLYVYDAGFHISYSEFISNKYAVEIRKTDGVVISYTIFNDNNIGIWSEYETFSPDDVTSNILNTYIHHNTFSENSTGIDLIINQRYFENLNINNNLIKNNSLGIDFSGGGYGARVKSVNIFDNIILNNNTYGLSIGQIYGYSDWSGEPSGTYPLTVENNIFVNNPIYWNYGGGVGGVTMKLAKNIIFNPRETLDNYSQGIYFNGGTGKSDLIAQNLIVSNGASLTLTDSYSDPSNKTFSYNTFAGQPLDDHSIVSSFGSGHVFAYNNFIKTENNFIVNNKDANSINAENNYWGTTTESEIQTAIYDYTDDFELGAVDYTPFATALNTTAPISPPANVIKVKSGSNIIFSWNANLESDVAGYKLYYGSPTGYSYSTAVDVGNATSYTLTGGDFDQEYAITAYDASKDGTDDQVDGNESWFSIANTLPVVTNVTASNADGSYKSGESIEIIITYDKAVTVTGTPQLTLETGDTDALANYSSGSGSTSLVFSYTVGAGQMNTDLDYADADALILNGGSMLDQAGNAVLRALPIPGSTGSLGANKNLVVDTFVPIVTLTTNQLSMVEDDSTVLTATLSAISTRDVVLTFIASGTAIADTDYTLSSNQITIAAGQTISTLTARGIDDAIDEIAETIILTPSVTNNGTLASSDALTIDLTDNDLPPLVTSVNATTVDGAYKVGDMIAITINFDKAVTVTGIPQLTLETGSSDALVDYSSGSGTTTLTFNYTIASGHNSDDLDYLASSSLALNSGTITETGGTSDATLTLPSPGTTNSLGANKALIIDTVVPVATISIDNLSIAEHESMTIAVALSTASSFEITVTLTSSGTATLNTDYAVSNTLGNIITIAVGDTVGTLTINGIEDRLLSEEDETIILTPSASNASLASGDDITITLLNNGITLTKTDDPFTGLSSGAVSWGDYDQDGDKDVAIMGQSSLYGAVTAIYRNDSGVFVDTEQNFLRLFDGDITWIDIDKDGYLDVVISGFNKKAQTILYHNEGGNSFSRDETLNLPQLFSTQMAWDDLDLDGDVDFAMMGINDEGVIESYIGFRESDYFKLIKDKYPGLIKGDIQIADVDLDGDNDLLYAGEDLNGNIGSKMVLNSLIKSNVSLSLPEVTGASIDLLNTGASGGLGVLIQGKNDVASFTALNIGSYDFSGISTALHSGDITTGDFDNNGGTDIVITGEDDNGTAITELYWEGGGQYQKFDVDLEGLRESTAEWVDYDMDGDLDLFLMGLTETGAKTVLYETEIENKKNAVPLAPSNLQTTDQGFGNIKFTWDAPNDDYSNTLGYVVRLGTSVGGSELSNTQSDLSTGARLISKAPSINTNKYETQLDPGTYYWSVQAVDNGLKGGAFASEGQFTLTYAWKSVNQGGIIDYQIRTVADPVLKMVDIDGDDDLDVLYGSQNAAGTQLLQFDGYRLVPNTESKFGFLSSGTLSDIQASDVNGDGIQDIWMSLNNGEGARFDFSLDSSFISAVGLSDYKLYNAKSQIVDLNNDGRKEVISLGLTNNTSAAVLKLYVLELEGTLNSPSIKITDQSDKITTLTASSFDFGDYDGDQDIDFLISGFNASNGLSSVLYNNNTEIGGQISIEAQANDFVAVRDGTTDFIDFDSDGDLDIIFTGTSFEGDVFDVYLNQLNEGKTDWPKITTNLSGIRNSKIDLGDFNSDGYTDIIYSGTLTGSGEVTKLSEYDPVIQQYVESSFDISDIIKATVEFGDIDGDGDLDFSIAGEDKNNSGQYIFRTYRNYRNESAAVEESSAAGSISDPAGAPMTVGKWSKNVRPSSPKAKATRTTNSPLSPNSTQLLNDCDVGTYLTSVEFSWESATDDHTPALGLTYALRIGTEPGGQDVLSSDASQSGLRMSASSGNSGHNLSWSVALVPGTYYWAVQAIDAAYVGSEFSEEQFLEVGTSGFDVNHCPIIQKDTFNVAEGSPKGTIVGNIVATDLDGDSLIYSIVDGNIFQTFSLDSLSGQLKIENSDSLDYEKIPSFSLLVSVSDSSSIAMETIVINLIDLDEGPNQPPTVSASEFSIEENALNGTIVGQINASDINGDSLIYFIAGGNINDAFLISTYEGEISVQNSLALDYEVTPNFSIMIAVSDGLYTVYSPSNISITDAEETLSLADASEMIYPNPTDGIINIKMAAFKEATIYNLSGKRILRSTDNRIDVSSLSEGVYIIKLENRSGDRFSSRLIKE